MIKRRIKKTGVFYVYIVRCRYGTYYSGYTIDLENRLKKHNEGKGAKYLRGKGPITLEYVKQYQYLKNALKAEARLKRLTKKQKQQLIDKR